MGNSHSPWFFFSSLYFIWTQVYSCSKCLSLSRLLITFGSYCIQHINNFKVINTYLFILVGQFMESACYSLRNWPNLKGFWNYITGTILSPDSTMPDCYLSVSWNWRASWELWNLLKENFREQTRLLRPKKIKLINYVYRLFYFVLVCFMVFSE